MPSCFSLTDKAKPELGPRTLSEIDDRMCAYFGQKPHPEKYYKGWYDYVGLSLAVGLTWEDIAHNCYNDELYASNANDGVGQRHWSDMAFIVEWLRQHYTSDAWRESKLG